MAVSRRALSNMPKTVHGGQAWRLDGVEDYSHNLNPFGPPPCIRGLMAAAADRVWHYPDDSSIGFRSAVAGEFGVSPENVVAGAGSSDIIRMFPNTFLEAGDRAAVFSPSFAEYSQQLMIAGAVPVRVPLSAEDDYRIDRGRLSQALEGAKALYICNPNNPTGRVTCRDDVLSIVDECRDRGVLVFLDETLLELVDGSESISCARYVGEYDNLVVAGSLTKSFAIPGIRIGFGIMHPDLADEMNKVRMTWNIGAAEQAVGEALIRDHMGYVRDAAEALAEENRRMFPVLKDMGMPVDAPSDSFFYFCDMAPLGLDAPELVRRMRDRGFMVRDCSSFGPEYSGCVRFCVKDRERDDRFLKALRASLG